MRSLAIAACFVLAGCAATRIGEPEPQGVASPSAAPPTDDAAEITAQLDVDAYRREEETVVCKREAPVGSRIPITRCYPTGRSAALDERERQELDEMRRQRQVLLEQQRIQSAMGVR